MIISLIGYQSDRQDAICFICVSSPLFGEAGFGFPGSIPGPATKYPVREKAYSIFMESTDVEIFFEVTTWQAEAGTSRMGHAGRNRHDTPG